MSDQNSNELIQSVLENEGKDIHFEEIPSETDSPLDDKVIEKGKTSPGPPVADGQEQAGPESREGSKYNTDLSDAPEQPIGNGSAPEEDSKHSNPAEAQGYVISLEHAQLMADTVLGVANNILEVGGGYFIKIRKHKDFYDFEEVIQIIDDQNVKNIRRIKLDEEDKALLKPLLTEVLRKQSKVMTVEQQLIGVAISIIIKKARAVMEIRAENEIMVERIRDVIKKTTAGANDDDPDESDSHLSKKEAFENNSDSPDGQATNIEETH